MFKRGKITQEGNKCLANILIFLSLPAVIINGFLVDQSEERVGGLLISAILAALTLVISMVVSRIFFKKDPIAQFAAAFSNPGFFGIPIITSCIGNDAVFYLAAYVAFLNLLQWTYGVSLLKGEKAKLEPKQFVTAPFLIAILIGLFFFFTRISVPQILRKTLSFVSGLNTPLAMFTIGVYLAQTNLKKSIRKGQLYKISAIKLLVVPALVLVLFMLIPQQYRDMKMALLIAVACPTGSNIAIYAQLHNRDYSYAVETVILSTLLSIVTLPLLVWISSAIW